MDHIQELRRYLPAIRVVRSAYEYIMEGSRRICELHERPLELYFYLLTERPTPYGMALGTGAYLPRGQKLSRNSCALTLEGKVSAINGIAQQGKYILGWAHSHGEMPAFHSGTDDRNTLSRVMQSGLETRIGRRLGREKQKEIASSREDGATHLVEYDERACEVVSLRKVRYACSLVVSPHRGEHYGVIAVQDEEGLHLLKDVEIEIVGDEKDIGVDERRLDEELEGIMAE